MGTIIHKIVAMDPDLKPVLRYKIDANNSEGRNEDGKIIKPSEFNYLSAFDLNSVDGKLKIIKILDREKVETIKLGLTVEDLAGIKGKQTATGKYPHTLILLSLRNSASLFNRRVHVVIAILILLHGNLKIINYILFFFALCNRM